ncbi:hypothetical protein COCMIDRAFT_35014 [Bipolaris oryzae ATCC 44560]|uniref:Uncharacterized protein n=1 Tax=Bipolaris oryzae ATCC 44560 TaxID=930090 RepID=W6ZBX4_COCMI|nr:uncharacterized protein COCMIDRAFT_35014 [Bipolaris oryzae ATCC 44560]EUC47485.1 hypothetical protein COCMIDRAFT_35014 [Bipolaris oryzae ATCC 44560]
MCTVSAGQGRTKLSACIIALPISLRNISIHTHGTSSTRRPWSFLTNLGYYRVLYVFTMSTPGSTHPSSPITWQSHMSIYGPLFAISLTDLSSDIYGMYCLFCRLRFAYHHSDFF